MTFWEAVLLVAAGIGGGLAGSVAGLASVTTYPALLLVGLPPVAANVTNTVALVFNGIGSVSGSLPELRGQRAQLKRLIPLAAIGGAAGAALLLSIPAEGFEKDLAEPLSYRRQYEQVRFLIRRDQFRRAHRGAKIDLRSDRLQDREVVHNSSADGEPYFAMP